MLGVLSNVGYEIVMCGVFVLFCFGLFFFGVCIVVGGMVGVCFVCFVELGFGFFVKFVVKWFFLCFVFGLGGCMMFGCGVCFCVVVVYDNVVVVFGVGVGVCGELCFLVECVGGVGGCWFFCCFC